MRTIFKNILVGVSLATVLISCETELDLQNPNANSLEELLQTDDGFGFLANGILDAYQKVPANEFYLTELRSDNSRANSQNGNFPALSAYQVDANNGDVATYYSNNMHTITHANRIIDNRFLAPESYQYAVGEAYFMRALCHFNLVRAYKNVPYIDKVLDITQNEAYDYPQLPEAEVYEKIIDDFKTSIAYLSGRDTDVYRPSEGAAICLAAKAYLSQPEPNYAEAELLLASVVQNSAAFGYSLLTTSRDASTDQNSDGVISDEEYFYELAIKFGEVFGNDFTGDFTEGETVLDGSAWENTADEKNSEVIFSIAYDLVSSDNYVTSDSGLDDQLETDSEAHSFAMTLQGPSNGVNIASSDLLQYMTPELQPVRFYANLKLNEYNAYLDDPAVDVFNNKFPTDGEIGDNDWIVLRYADVLLLYAEAILAGEDSTTDENALDAFNQVRARAGLTELGVLTRQELLDERRMEFVYENQRLFDLIRFDEQDNVLTVFSVLNSLSYTPDRVYLPFPQREIDNAPGLYNQNNGY